MSNIIVQTETFLSPSADAISLNLGDSLTAGVMVAAGSGYIGAKLAGNNQVLIRGTVGGTEGVYESANGDQR